MLSDRFLVSFTANVDIGLYLNSMWTSARFVPKPWRCKSNSNKTRGGSSFHRIPSVLDGKIVITIDEEPYRARCLDRADVLISTDCLKQSSRCLNLSRL